MVNGKHFPVKIKTLSGQRKILLGFPGKCFPESSFWEITFQTFMCLFAIRKVDQRKTISNQRKI